MIDVKKIICLSIFLVAMINISAQRPEVPAMKPEQTEDWSRFDPDSTLIRPGYITVIHNGIVIQNHAELKGPSEYIGIPKYKYHESKRPLMLQNHTIPVPSETSG